MHTSCFSYLYHIAPQEIFGPLKRFRRVVKNYDDQIQFVDGSLFLLCLTSICVRDVYMLYSCTVYVDEWRWRIAVLLHKYHTNKTYNI